MDRLRRRQGHVVAPMGSLGRERTRVNVLVAWVLERYGDRLGGSGCLRWLG